MLSGERDEAVGWEYDAESAVKIAQVPRAVKLFACGGLLARVGIFILEGRRIRVSRKRTASSACRRSRCIRMVSSDPDNGYPGPYYMNRRKI